MPKDQSFVHGGLQRYLPCSGSGKTLPREQACRRLKNLFLAVASGNSDWVGGHYVQHVCGRSKYLLTFALSTFRVNDECVESLHRSLRKIIKTRGGFPNEEAALKLLFLALWQAAKKWTMPIHHRKDALNHFTILWPERMPDLERVAS